MTDERIKQIEKELAESAPVPTHRIALELLAELKKMRADISPEMREAENIRLLREAAEAAKAKALKVKKSGPPVSS